MFTIYWSSRLVFQALGLIEEFLTNFYFSLTQSFTGSNYLKSFYDSAEKVNF